MYPDEEGNVCHQKPSQDVSMKLDCSGGFGATTHVTATFAFFAVSKSISKLIKKHS